MASDLDNESDISVLPGLDLLRVLNAQQHEDEIDSSPFNLSGINRKYFDVSEVMSQHYFCKEKSNVRLRIRMC